jgi:hypothetical protein
VESHALDVGGRLERREELGDVNRVALVARPAAPGTGRAGLPDQGRRGHLAARHPVDGVVDEEDRDLLAAVGGVDDLRGPYRREIAVSLVADDEAFGPGPLQRRGDGRGPAVGGLHVADVEVVIGED